jgi:2-haloacid dehalogenase
LLDLKALDIYFARVFGEAGVRRLWFAQFVQNALVSIVTDRYKPFGAIGAAALHQVATARQVVLTAEDEALIIEGMKTLPPHPEVPNALRRLYEAGWRLCALTNNTLPVVQAQLTNAGLAPLFERILSADTVQRLKPAREPYLYAAHEMRIPLSALCIIAAHAWDTTGALSAGAHAAFVARPGMALNPLAPRPEIVGRDLVEVAEQLVAREQ